MDAGHSCHRDTKYTQVAHRLSVESAPHQVYTRCVPFILLTTLFKPDVAASVKLCNQATDVLLRDLVNLFLSGFEESFKYF
jgi:hypothetical protein